MSDKLPRLTAKELIRVLERKGCELDRSRGSHHIYIHPATRRTLTVPIARRVMSIGTPSRLLKDADIGRDQLRKLPQQDAPRTCAIEHTTLLVATGFYWLG